MNPITYLALLFAPFSWFSGPAVKTTPPAGCNSHYDSTLNLTVYTNVETQPEYPGGAAPWGRYINRNLAESNLDPKVDCNVKIKMIVDSTGAIRKAVAIHGDTEVKEPNANEKEVLRVYKKSGFWQPGTCGGNNVTTEFVQTFNACNRQ